MSINLMRAHRQWASRPSDERFWNLDDLLRNCEDDRLNSVNIRIPASRIAVSCLNGDIRLNGNANTTAGFTNYSFGQFCRYAGCPPTFLPSLNPETAVTVLNERLEKTIEERELADDHGMRFYMRNTDNGPVIRAMLSDAYQRLHDYDIVSRLIDFQSLGWRIPPARPVDNNFPGSRIATEEDCLDVRSFLSVHPGDVIAPAGLYRGDRNMFCFMVNEDRRIDDGSEGGLSRGFFVENSEVGDSSFRITMFLYRVVCGNHIVWGAENVTMVRFRHTKNIDAKAMNSLKVDLVKWADESSVEQEATIRKLQRFEIANNKEDVVEFIYNQLGPAIGKRQAGDIYDDGVVNADVDGHPKTVYGYANAITRFSQSLTNADGRHKMDLAAGELMKMFS